MLSSFIQNAQSTAGTMISAFGKASEPSAFLRPRMWSPCMCEISTMSIDFGSMPLAAMVGRQQADRRRDAGPKPVSISTSLLPVLTTSGLNGATRLPFGM